MLPVTLDMALVGFVVAFLLPTLTALVTGWNAPAAVKALVLVVLGTITTAFESILWIDHVTWKTFLFDLLGQLFLATMAHFGFTKPLRLSGSESPLARSGPQLGSPSPGRPTA